MHSKHPGLIFPYIHTCPVEMYGFTGELIGYVEDVRERMLFHPIHHNECSDCNEVSAVIVFKRPVVQVVQKRGGCIVSKPTEESITNFSG